MKMRWIRVKIFDLEKLTLPDACPNCLSPGTKVSVPIFRNLVVPEIASLGVMKWSSQWAFCPECAKRFTRYERRRRWFVFAPAVFIAFLAAFVAAMARRPNGVPSAFWFLLAAGLVGSFAMAISQYFCPKSSSSISNFPAVRLIRGGHSFTGKHQWGDYYFAHPIYLERLLVINDPEIMKVNERALKKALLAYGARNL